VILEMDEFLNSNSEQLFFIKDHSSVPGLSLLKRLERAKLLELHNSIDSQEQEQRIGGKMKSKMLIQGKQWEWQADDGTWQSFEPEEQRRLEAAVEMGQKTVPFVDSIHFMHTADLTQMTLVNMKTGIGKKIKRTPVLHSGPHLPKKVRHNYGWNFDDSSDDDRILAEDTYTYNSSAIDSLGSTFSIPSVRTPRSLMWSRHGSIRDRHANSFVPGNSSLRSHGIGDAESRESFKGPSTVWKKIPYKSRQKASVKSNSINARVKSDEMNKLKKWLQKIGLEDYYSKFRREKITLKEAHSLNEQDLKKLGLPMGARKRFTESIKDLKIGREPPHEYLCPITMALMTEPVLLSDGFTYEKLAIEKWLKENKRSPMTNGVLESTILTPNRQLKKLIDDFRAFET